MAFVALGACPPTTLPIEYLVRSDGHGEPASCTLVAVDAKSAQFPAVGLPLVSVAGSAPTVRLPATVRFPYSVGLPLSASAAGLGTLGLAGPWLKTTSST